MPAPPPRSRSARGTPARASGRRAAAPRSAQPRSRARPRPAPRRSRDLRRGAAGSFVNPSPAGCDSTRVTGGTRSSVARARPASSQRAVTTWTRERVSSPSAPSARTRPSIRITARSQVASTSGRMCVDRITVFVRPMRRISSRTSTIWFGSRPLVGSSRIRISRVVQDRRGQADALAVALRQVADRSGQHLLDRAFDDDRLESSPTGRRRRGRACRP